MGERVGVRGQATCACRRRVWNWATPSASTAVFVDIFVATFVALFSRDKGFDKVCSRETLAFRA